MGLRRMSYDDFPHRMSHKMGARTPVVDYDEPSQSTTNPARPDCTPHFQKQTKKQSSKTRQRTFKKKTRQQYNFQKQGKINNCQNKAKTFAQSKAKNEKKQSKKNTIFNNKAKNLKSKTKNNFQKTRQKQYSKTRQKNYFQNQGNEAIF